VVEEQPKKKNMQNIFDAMREEGELVIKTRWLKFLENPRVQLFLLIITLYALFADDYRYLTGRKAIDPVYDVFILICTGIFFVEIVIASIFKPGYFNSYYFYLDIVSTGSLILDYYPVKAELIIFGYTQLMQLLWELGDLSPGQPLPTHPSDQAGANRQDLQVAESKRQ
jgi:hypothetical protein